MLLHLPSTHSNKLNNRLTWWHSVIGIVKIEILEHSFMHGRFFFPGIETFPMIKNIRQLFWENSLEIHEKYSFFRPAIKDIFMRGGRLIRRAPDAKR